MKNKQAMKMAAAVVVLAVAVGGYFLMRHWNSSESDAQDESTTIELTSLTGSDVEKFSYVYNDKTYSFVKENETWYYEEDRDFPLKQTSIEGKLSSVVSTTATRELEADSEALTEYGLDSPVNTITLTDSEGNETVFEIGDANDSTGEYYCRLNRSNKVYMISSSLNSMMSFDIYTIADMDSFPYIESSRVKALSVDNGSEVKDYDSEEDSAAYTAVGSLYYSSHVDYNCTDLSRYGLDQPQYIITIKYTPETETADETQESTEDTGVSEEDLETLTLYVGTLTDNGYYVRVDGSTQVHLMSATLLESLLN